MVREGTIGLGWGTNLAAVLETLSGLAVTADHAWALKVRSVIKCNAYVVTDSSIERHVNCEFGINPREIARNAT